jgi:hypothetical protein
MEQAAEKQAWRASDELLLPINEFDLSFVLLTGPCCGNKHGHDFE